MFESHRYKNAHLFVSPHVNTNCMLATHNDAQVPFMPVTKPCVNVISLMKNRFQTVELKRNRTIPLCSDDYVRKIGTSPFLHQGVRRY